MSDQPFIDWAKAAQTDALIKGALLDPRLRHDYIGAALVIRDSIFFMNAYKPEVREAIASCFDEYAFIAKDRLRWLTQDGKRPTKLKPGGLDRRVFTGSGKSDGLSVYVTSGETAADASLWEFQVFGLMKWEEEKASGGTSTLTFSVPIPFLAESPTTFQRLFVAFARRLNAVSGYGGYAVNLSLPEAEANTPTEYWLSKRFPGMDVGDSAIDATHLRNKIKTVSWLTMIDKSMLEAVGGIQALLNALPPDWFAFYDVDGGIAIQAGPIPQTGQSLDAEGKTPPIPPAGYVLLNRALKDLRVPSVWRLQVGLSGSPVPYYSNTPVSDEWLRRFDVSDDRLLACKATLLTDPVLTPESVLPGRL